MRRFALVLLPVVLLAAACGGSKSTTKTSTPKTSATVAVATKTKTMTPASTAGRTATPSPSTPSVEAENGQDAASTLFGAVNPFELLNGLSGEPSSTDADPALKEELLDGSALPSGFTSMGEFAYALPTKYGDVQLAANVFTNGDASSSQIGTTVMSGAVALPADAMREFNDAGGVQRLRDFSDADLQDLRNTADQSGFSFSDVHVLDGSDLGDGGAGMHVVMDFSALLGAFGAPTEENPFAAGLAMDLYLFLRGDHMLMTVVMWPAADTPGVDSRCLAEAMASG